MAVKFIIGLDSELSAAAKKRPKRTYSAFSAEFLDDLVEVSSKGVLGGAPLDQVEMNLTVVFNKHKKEFKDEMKRKIASDAGVRWDDIAHTQAYSSVSAPTFNQQVETSWRISKQRMRTSVFKVKNRNSKYLGYLSDDKLGQLERMGIKGKTEKELLRAMRDDIVNKLGTALGGNMNGVESATRLTSQTKNRYEKAKITLKGQVIYRLGDRERHCQECIALNGNKYKSIGIAPSLPRHTRCGCFYEET